MPHVGQPFPTPTDPPQGRAEPLGQGSGTNGKIFLIKGKTSAQLWQAKVRKI